MPSALTPLEIAFSLRSRLPDELHDQIIPFAELIAAYVRNAIDGTTFAEKAPAAALAALGDEPLAVNDTLIAFGANGQYGDVKIGDVVRGSKVVINLAGAPTRPLGSLPAPPARYNHSLPALPERLIGREKLFPTMNAWLNDSRPMLLLEAHGGTGKTSLVATWLRDHVDTRSDLSGVIYWSCYEPGNDLRTLVRYALAYCEQRNLNDPEVLQAGYQECLGQFQRCLQQGRYLLVIDDAERLLWGYAQSRSNAVGAADPHFHDCTHSADEALLRLLMRSPHTKTLLVSRHVPRVLRDGNRVRSGIAHQKLSGLNLPAAREMLIAHGVHWSDQGQLDRFLRMIDCHPLAITQVGALTRAQRGAARGSFDHWYQTQGCKLHLEQLTYIEERHERILDAALRDLGAEAQWLLYRIAFVFSRSVEYDSLTILNDDLPEPPPLADLPPLPLYESRPHPFGSRRLVHLRRQLEQRQTSFRRLNNPFELPPLPRSDAAPPANPFELPPLPRSDAAPSVNPFELPPLPPRPKADADPEIARLQQEIADEETAEITRRQTLMQRQAQLWQELDRLRREREEHKRRHQEAHEQSPAYRAAVERFHALLEELEARGLLENDHERYRLHPLVREHILRLNPPRPPAVRPQRVDHFVRVGQIDPETVHSVDALMRAIAAYRLHILDGDPGYAAKNYFALLSTPLWRLGEHWLTIELLSDLFPKNNATGQPDFAALPDFREAISSDRSRVLNDLALSLMEVGRYSEAQQLFTNKLDPKVVDKGSELVTGVNNFAWLMGELNQLARMHSAYRLVDATATTGRAWARQRLFRYAVLTGQWAEAEVLYAECLTLGETVNDSKPWRAALAAQYARMQVLRRAPDAEAALQDALEAARATRERYRLEAIYADWAVLHLRAGRYAQAQECLDQALEIDRTSGRSTGRGLSLRARITLAQGDTAGARDLLEQALGDPRIPPGDRALVYCNAADVALRLGDETAAATYAQTAYTYAWADGPPHCHGVLLERAQALLTVLDRTPPLLPSVSPEQVEPLPHAEAVHERLAGNDSSLTRQAPFTMRRFTWVQMGTLAAFGVEDRDLVVAIATKLTCISYLPAPLTVSRQGEPAPVCDDEGIPAEHRSWSELRFTPEETEVFSKLFAILYVESVDEAGEPVFAYTNVRLDRISWLLARGDKDAPFNLADYSTTVVVGAGAPTADDRAKLRNDYLFGEHHLTVRLFPPLDQL